MDRDRALSLLTALAAGVFVAFGLWAFLDPESFFDEAATFEPYNEHLVHDIGAFQIGIGAILALALWRRGDAIFAALGGAGVGSGFHTIAHVMDDDLGGMDSDPYVFGLFTVLLLAGAWWRWSGARR
jgi:hypothetical protein